MPLSFTEKTCSDFASRGFTPSTNKKNNVNYIKNYFEQCDDLVKNRTISSAWGNEINNYINFRSKIYLPFLFQACDADINVLINDIVNKLRTSGSLDESNLSSKQMDSLFKEWIKLYPQLSEDEKKKYKHFSSADSLRLHILGKTIKEFGANDPQFELLKDLLVSNPIESSKKKGRGMSFSDIILTVSIFGCIFYYYFIRTSSSPTKQKKKSKRDLNAQSTLRFIREGLQILRS